MRPIKFRGETFSGELVYGDLLQHENKTAICTSAYALVFYAATKKGVQCVVNVKPESVAQFVGYDVEGQEVYEGDELKAGRYGEDGRAKIFCSIDAYDFRFGARFDNYKLKK